VRLTLSWAGELEPTATDSPRQQRRILVLRRHDDAVSLKAAEVLCERQGDSWTTARKGGIGDGKLLEFRNIGDAWVFDAQISSG